MNHPPIAAPLGERTTERLDLRKFRPNDLDELARVFEKREVWQFPYGRSFTREETSDFLDAQIREWDDCGFGCWIARERVSDRVIGYVGISVPTFLPEILPAIEVGWRFDPAVWGMGFASEGARAALAEGFETLGLDEICSVPQADNPASSRVCDRIGMRLEREVKIPANSRRGELEGLLYKMTRARYEGLHPPPDSCNPYDIV
jgi:RimJ/RimL family protein N-acetyltransferase